ncbi:MAG: hypothetical protein ACP6IQ_01670 [Candidatus Njordarchaeia archaeon]
MQKIVISILVIGLLLFSGSAVASTQFSIQETHIGVNHLSEYLNIYIGKGGTMVITLSYVGGNITTELDPTASYFQDLYMMKLGVGTGYRWWLYYHKAIWPDIPPGLSLILVYNASSSIAIPRAKSLAAEINDIYSINLQPIHYEVRGTYTIVGFFQAVDTATAKSFAKNNILSLFPNEGFGAITQSEAIDAAMDADRYFRGTLALIKDEHDIDLDNDFDEYIPVIGTAFVVPNAVHLTDDEWFNFSLESALNLNETFEFTHNPNCNISIAKVHFPLPVEIDETRSTLPDNPMYEFTGLLLYALKVGNYTREPEEDLLLTFKPFNPEEEIRNSPKIAAIFLVANATSSMEIINGTEVYHTELEFELRLRNYGGSAAQNLTIVLPLPDRFLEYLRFVASWLNVSVDSFFEGDWNFTYVHLYDINRPALITTYPSLDVNDTVTLKFNLTVHYIEGFGSAGITIPVGPIVIYRDSEGKVLFSTANGFSLIPRITWGLRPRYIVAFLRPTSVNVVGDTLTGTVNVTVINFGGGEIKDVKIYLIGGISNGLSSVTNPTLFDMAYISTVGDHSSESRELQFEVKMRPGFWYLVADVNFKAWTPMGRVQIDILTNGLGLLVPPPASAIMRWRQRHGFPLPHTELEISKNATYYNDTSTVEVTITIKNIGDEETSFNVFDFWTAEYIDDPTASDHGVIEYLINGTDKRTQTNVVYDSLLGVVRIKSPTINLQPNETVVIKYKVKINSSLSAEDLVINPSLVKYRFGEYAPDIEAGPEDCAKEGAEREGGEYFEKHEEEGGSEALLRVHSYGILQDEGGNFLDSYTNAILSVVSTTSGGEGEEIPTGLPRTFIIIGAVIGVLAVAGVILVLKRR